MTANRIKNPGTHGKIPGQHKLSVCLVSPFPFIVHLLYAKCKIKTTTKALTGLEDFPHLSSLLLGCSQKNVNILPCQIERIVLGGLGAPNPRSSQRTDSGQIYANLTFSFRGASLKWLCLLRAWCGVSIARCLGLRRVCSWSFYWLESCRSLFSAGLLSATPGNSAWSTSFLDDNCHTIVFFPRSLTGWGRRAPSLAFEYASFLATSASDGRCQMSRSSSCLQQEFLSGWILPIALLRRATFCHTRYLCLLHVVFRHSLHDRFLSTIASRLRRWVSR